MEERFREAVEKAKFTFLEIAGFKQKPALALIAGMAIGYKMALEDFPKIFSVSSVHQNGRG